MKLELNREYALRHLGVAALLAALAAWSVYDGAVAWPAANAKWERESGRTLAAACAARVKGQALTKDEEPPHWPEKVTAQYYQAGVLGLLGLLVAGFVGYEKRKTLTWDETAMCGTLTGGKPLAFTDVRGLDTSKWESKSILGVRAKDGRTFVLDAWHHSGAKDLAAELMSREEARQV